MGTRVGVPHQVVSTPSDSAESTAAFMVLVKRRVYRIVLVLTAVACLLPMVWAVKNGSEVTVAYLATNGVALLVCLIAFIGLSRIEWVPGIERVLVAVIVLYDISWSIVNLALARNPVQEGIVGGAPVFILCCMLVCLVMPYELLSMSLFVFFAVHLSLTWMNLARMPWGRAHTAEVTTDMVLLVAILVLCLLNTYQRLVNGAEDQSKRLFSLAYTDENTGLPNRRAVEVTAPDAYDPCMLMTHIVVRNPRSPADVAETVQRAKKCLGENLVTIFGGQAQVAVWNDLQFVVVMPEWDRPRVLRAAERIRTAAAASPELADVEVHIGLTHRRPEESALEAIERAESFARVAVNGQTPVVSGA